MKTVYRGTRHLRLWMLPALSALALITMFVALRASLASPPQIRPGVIRPVSAHPALRPALHLKPYRVLQIGLRSRPRVAGPGYSLPQYTLQDEGTWPSSNSALALNDAGNIAGQGETSSFYAHGNVVSTTGAVQDIGTLVTGNGFSGIGLFGAGTEFNNIYSLTGFNGGNNGQDFPNLSEALNASGQITGFAQVNSNDVNHAILWDSANGLVDIGTLPVYPTGNSYGAAINAGGQVAGGANVNSTTSHAFVWTPTSPNGITGSMVDLGVISDSGSSPFAQSSFAYGLNDSGEVVGQADAGNNSSHAFVDSADVMYDLGTLNGTTGNSQALGINAYGEVYGLSDVTTTIGPSAGNLVSHAFLWVPSSANGTAGSMLDLGTLSTRYDFGSTPTALSGSAEVVGQASVDGINPASQVPPSSDPNGPFGATYVAYGHAFSSSAGGPMADLGALYCGTGGGADSYNVANYTFYSWANGVNDAGTVVGASSDNGLLYAPINGSAPPHAFVSTNGFMYDLNDLLTGSNVSGWTLSDAYSVNNSDQIACIATGPDGKIHAVLLTPTTPLTAEPTPVVPADTVLSGGVYTSGLFPQNNLAGNPDFTLAINGSHFAPDAQVTFNGDTLAGIKVESDSLILATVPASEIATAGNYPVVVTNPGNAAPSTAVTFTVLPAVVAPTLTSLSPNKALADSPGFEMTIRGTHFDSTTRVNFIIQPHVPNPSTAGAVQLTPDSVASDGTSLTVAIPTSDLYNPPNAASSGFHYVFEQGLTAAITVTNYPNSPDSYAANNYGLTSNSEPFTITNPKPTITKISPAQVSAGASGEYVTITGTGFNQSTQVSWVNPNDGTGSTKPTFYVDNDTQLSIFLNAGDTTNAAVVPITVTNPAVLSDNSDGGSASVNFTIGNPVPPPAITKLVPASIQTGLEYFTLVIQGSNLVSGATVQFGSDKNLTASTVAGDGTSLSVIIPGADVAAPGTASVAVTDPQSGTSNAETFTIDDPQPVITSIAPTSATAGGAAFSLTVTGTGFAPGATVTFGSDSPITPTSISATKIVAPIPAADILRAGTPVVTVTNPNPNKDPGVFTSNGATFTVNAPIAVTGMSLTPATVTGGQSSIGTVMLSAAAPAAGVTVTLTSDNPAATVPPTVLVTPGSKAAPFTVTTVGVTQTQTVTIKASYLTSSVSVTLTVGASSSTNPPPNSPPPANPPPGSPPLARILLTASPGPGAVNLSWTPPANANPGVTYYLYRGGSLGAETLYKTGLANNSYDDLGVTNGKVYYYEVSTADLKAVSNEADAAPIDPNNPTPASKLQIAISTIRSWSGNVSQFTATLTNTGGTPQYVSDAQVTPQGTVGTGWIGRDSALPTKPLLPGAHLQVTFNLDVPANAPGGTSAAPLLVPLTLTVDGNGRYLRDFNLELYQKPPTQLTVTVQDTHGNPIPNALLAFNKDAKVYGTDGNGQLTLPETPGSLIVYAYQTGFLPNQQSVALTSGTTGSVTIQLAPGDPLAVTSFTVTPISGDQAAADGISLDDPKNYNVYKFTLKIGVRTVAGDGAYRDTTPYNDGTGIGIYDSRGTLIAVAYPFGSNPNKPQFVVVWLTIQGQIHYLKQFFAASAVITNDTPYTIGSATADISLPSGLELPTLNGQKQKEKRTLGDIGPFQSTAAEWIIRGDDPGDYDIGGSVDGSLQLGGAKFPVSSDLSGSATVEEPELELNFTTPKMGQNVNKGTPFTLGIDITNQSDIDLDGASIDLPASDLVNCYLPASQPEQQDLGTIPAQGTVHVDYQIIPDVSGPVVGLDHYTTNDPAQMPPVKIRAFLLEAKDEQVTTTAGKSITVDALKDAVAVAIGENLGTLKYVAITPASSGIAAIDTKNKVLTYQPDAGFTGADFFGYSIVDGKGDTATATVLVNVIPPSLGQMSVSPKSVAVNSGDLPITLTGTGFYPGSQVYFNGALLNGYDVSSSTKISAVIPASLLQSAGDTQVTVYNQGISSLAAFTIIGNPKPLLTVVSPNTAPAGKGGQSIMVSGAGFVGGSQIAWNGVPLPTTFLNAAALTAQVPGSDLAVGTAQVTVVSPAPGGGPTAPLPFTITPPAPVLQTSLASLTSGAGVAAQFSVANTGSAAATKLRLVSAKLLFVSGGKAVTLAASALTQPASGTLAAGGSTRAGAVFTGSLPAKGAPVIIQVTFASDQFASSGAALAGNAP